MIRNPRNSHRPASSKPARPNLHQRRRKLQLERLEARELLALLSSGNGDGHLQVWVNEYGAFGRSGDLEVTTVLNPSGPREINDAFYDPAGTALGRSGTTFESGIALRVGTDPTVFLTDGTIANTGEFENGLFQTPLDPNNRTLRSTFFYPNTALADGTGATLRIDLFQQVIPRYVSGTAPVGVTLQQQYTITNLTGSPVDVEVFRYYDGDQLHDGSFTNDGAGMRQVIQNNPEFMWMTNASNNTNLNDPSYIEVRSGTTGIVRPNRWEVGLARGVLTTAPNPPYSPANPGKNLPSQPVNGALVQQILNGGPLRDDIIRTPQADADGNNFTDANAGADWAVALRNSYTIPGSGNTIYLAETQFGDGPIGDIPPPVIPPPQLGTVAGQKFSDRNGNGSLDSGEFGVSGFRIYADLNNDALFTPGEPSTVTGNGGFYQFSLNVGTYTIREVNQPNWTQTAPALGFHTITINAAGDVINNINFGNQATPATVSGMVFDDFNKNGRLDAGEGGIAGAVIYVDLNNNNIQDVSDPSTTSGAGGAWTIASLDPGTYVIRQIPPAGYNQSFPSNNGAQVVSLQPGQVLAGVNFGNVLQDGQVNGKVYFDLNNNGVIDPGEPGAANVIVYVDRDNNCNIGLGENAIYTGPSGTFGLMGIRPGTYTVRIAPPAGLEQILPGGGSGTCPGGLTITVGPGGITGDTNFLVASTGGFGTLDFGDAPAPYPTTLAQNGARATVARDFGLGALQDTEFDGQPSPLADNDDFITSPDEDGVQFVDGRYFGRGQTYNISVTVETGTRSAGRLQAFFDWNRDGDWNDPGERVVSNLVLPTGTHIIPITVPAGAVSGLTFARFRYGYEQNLGPTGASILGEVEDHNLFIVGAQPDAVNDPDASSAPQYTITYDASAPPYIFNVLANDIPSQFGPLTVLPTLGLTGTTGTVTVRPDGQIEYIPSGTDTLDTFTYTVRDPAGNTDTATVTVTILLPPLLQDDSYFFDAYPGTVTLDVLANDNPVLTPLTITGKTNGSSGGTVAITNGGTTLSYTPSSPLFAGTETFTYTATNGSGVARTATVTVTTNPLNNPNAEVSFDLDLLKLNGVDPVDDNVFGQGQLFKVRVRVEDLRLVSPAPDTNQLGVVAAYLDLFFDPNVFEIARDVVGISNHPDFGFAIEFIPNYTSAATGSDDTPGLLDEVGATYVVTSGNPYPGDGSFGVFIVTMRVLPSAPNGSTSIIADPSDNSESAVYVYNPLQPERTPDQIRFSKLDIVIDSSEGFDNDLNTGPSGEGSANGGGGTGGTGNRGITGTGKWHNFNLKTDVNGDGQVAPIDALIIINALNSAGARSLDGTALPRSLANPVWLDTDGDDTLTPLDALLVINRLNSRPSGEAPQGEAPQGEAPVQAMSSSVIVSAATPASFVAPAGDTSNTSSSTLTIAPGETVMLPLSEVSSSTSTSPTTAAATDASLDFSSDAWAAGDAYTGASATADFGNASGASSDDDEEFELLLADLAEDTCHQWR